MRAITVLAHAVAQLLLGIALSGRTLTCTARSSITGSSTGAGQESGMQLDGSEYQARLTFPIRKYE